MGIVTIDFETESIVVGSATPPKPIGVAIKIDEGSSFYYAFGHVGENGILFRDPNGSKGLMPTEECNIQVAKNALSKVFSEDNEYVFHNAKFDLRVLKHYFGLFPKCYESIHDTMLLLFLLDPNQKNLGLKESAERLLGIKPTEKDELKEYMTSNQGVLGIKVSTVKKKDNYYMGMLKYAPYEIVGDYACNDVEITYELFKYTRDKILNTTD